MIVSNAANNATPASGASSAASASPSTVDYQSFLKLLIAEMKNQDPTKPMDATQQVAQLATFSAVEQAVQTNKKLDSLLTTSALQQAEAVIGHQIKAPDGTDCGKVISVQIGDSGAVFATTDTGFTVRLGTGVTIF